MYCSPNYGAERYQDTVLDCRRNFPSSLPVSYFFSSVLFVSVRDKKEEKEVFKCKLL